MPKKIITETMQPVLSDLLSYEIGYGWSREKATLAATTTPLPLGTVLQKGALAFEVIEAEGTATAVLARSVEKSDEAQNVIVFVRGCILKKDALQYPADFKDADKTEAIKDLETSSIVIR